MSKENESEGLKQIYPNFYKANYYEILGIKKNETITSKKITDIFRDFKSKNELTGEIVEAYNVLIDPIPRKMYQDARMDIVTRPNIDSPRTIISSENMSSVRNKSLDSNRTSSTTSISSGDSSTKTTFSATASNDETEVFKENYKTNIRDNTSVSLYDKLLIDPSKKNDDQLDREVQTNAQILLELFAGDAHAINQINSALASLKDKASRAAYSNDRNDSITSEHTTTPIKIEGWDKIKQEQIIEKLAAKDRDEQVKADIKKLRSTFRKLN